MLKEVARHNMELSSLVVVEARKAAAAASADAEAPKPAAAPRNAWYPAAALAHSRLARSLRFCMTLAIKSHEDRLTREARIANVREAETQERKKRLKTQVEKAVGQAIERHVEREQERLIESEDEIYDEQAEIDKELRLYDELAERLEDDDIEHDLGEISRGEMAVRICQDLRIEPALELWEDSHWAREEVRRKVPGSPFAGRSEAEPEQAEAQEAEPEEARPEPEAAKPEEAELPKPEPPGLKPGEPEPEAPAVPPRRNIDWYRTPEHQRELEEHRARMRARIYNGL